MQDGIQFEGKEGGVEVGGRFFPNGFIWGIEIGSKVGVSKMDGGRNIYIYVFLFSGRGEGRNIIIIFHFFGRQKREKIKLFMTD